MSWSPEPSELGFLVGLLVGEGSFGGDGRQPQITLRMHVRHHDLFLRLVELVPGSRLYGPYDHGGRRYYQWMVRGAPLRDDVVPVLRQVEHLMDDHTRARFAVMCRRYRIGEVPRAADEP
jgi:hypothetical protein